MKTNGDVAVTDRVDSATHLRSRGTTVLFVDSFTTAVGRVPQPSSDAIGYGITAAGVIRRGLSARGYEVIRPDVRVRDDVPDPDRRAAWTIACYDAIFRALSATTPDIVVCFHAFAAFPAEIRRMAFDLGLDVPIIGYTHGSHWDPSDRFRTDRYPGMRMVDLANLDVMQRVLLVSEHLRTVLLDEIRAFSRQLADEFEPRMAVIGLPLDVEFIDACRDPEPSDRATVVYNHAPIDSKQPTLFLAAMSNVLEALDVDLLLTRAFPESRHLHALHRAFGERVIRGEDLPLEDYYRRLWQSDIQVSTATHESLGVATLEAMYTENYCIVPRIGSYPEILGETYEGMYDGSRSELVRRLKDAIGAPGRRRAVARRLPERTDRYRGDVVVDKLVAVIEAVLVEARSGS